ncbi:MAG: prenyltransferase [Bacteroidaceae bacterium]|nr:prenyltransferase [Bacteroidaceae bacterium]MBR5890970.1 prenyltransferase [Bacteroidaceae bacterium]
MNKHSFKSWLLATRPWSFPASGMPILVTLAYLFWLDRNVDWVIGVWTLLNIVFFHASGNVWSDYFDFTKGVDRENNVGATSLTSGEFTPKEIKRLALVLLAISSISGIALVFCTGIPTLFLGILGVLLTLLYPWLKYNALGDVDIFLTYSLLPILGTTYVATGALNAEALWLAMPIGLITVGILHANNARDIEHDRLAGIRTFAMNVGKKASAIIYCAEVILPFVWIVAGIVIGVFPILSLLVLPALKPVLDNVKKVMRFPVEGEKMLWGIDEATAKIQLIFSVLLAVSLFVDKAFV